MGEQTVQILGFVAVAVIVVGVFMLARDFMLWYAGTKRTHRLLESMIYSIDRLAQIQARQDPTDRAVVAALSDLATITAEIRDTSGKQPRRAKAQP